MKKTTRKAIDYVAIDNYLWEVKRYIALRYGNNDASIEIEPLSWYIGTGRASCDFLHKLVEAKPFMVARRLHLGGTYDEAIARVKKCIGYDD